MRFDITSTAMNGLEQTLDDLDAILGRAEIGIHILDIADPDELLASSWYGTCRPNRRKVLEEFVRVSAYRGVETKGPHRRRIPVTDAASARRANALAYSEFRVLLENADSDGRLVKLALHVFATPATLALCYGHGASCTPKAVEIESRGGIGELKKLLEVRLEEAAMAGLEARIVVVQDSDAEWLGDAKPAPDAVAAVCAAKGVPCPPLTKRMAENYVPDSVWSAWAADRENTAHRAMVKALLSLTPGQRDFVKFDRPSTPPWKNGKIEVATLYAGVAVSVYDELTRSSLKKLAESALEFALKESLPSPAEISTRDANADLERIVRTIEDGL
jgi:hypothetical protein